MRALPALGMQLGHPRTAGRLVGFAAVFYGAMFAAALVWAGLRGLLPGWWHFDDGGGIPAALIAAVLLGLAGVGMTRWLEHRNPAIRRLGERFASILGGATRRDAVLLALFSAIGEEALFRGCLQQDLGFWPATLLFGAVHTGPERVYVWWTASALVFGLGLGLLFDHGGGLLAPIVMHFTINVVNIRELGRRGASAGREGIALVP